MLEGEIVQQEGHRRLFLLIDPSLLEGLEKKFVELTHKAEAGALVEEVELFIVFVTTLCLAV
jgi:hypothetical protein